MSKKSKDGFDSLARRKRMRPISTGKKVTAQARDILWFEKIHQHGPLPASYLHAFSKHLRRSEKRAQDRLTDLFNEGRTAHNGRYLDRPLQQFRTIDSRYNELVYDLMPASVRALKTEKRYHEANNQHSGPWLHRFMVSCITASIELATLMRDDIAFIPQYRILERAETDLRNPTRIKDPKSGKSYTKNLVPDALFGLEYRVKGKSYYRFFLLEADRGTEPTTSTNFHRKSHLRNLLQYREYIGKGLYKSHLGLTASMMVLNVFTEEAKLKRVLKLTEELASTNGNSYMLHRVCDRFGPVFNPPKPMPEFLNGPWPRAGQDAFSIAKP
jgi:hypothetical protein